METTTDADTVIADTTDTTDTTGTESVIAEDSTANARSSKRPRTHVLRGPSTLPVDLLAFRDPDEINECRLYSVQEVAELLGAGETFVRDLVTSGELKRIILGREPRQKIRIMHTTLRDWLRSQED